MKILLAVDFSPVGRRTTGAGYRLAQKIASEITFFHCAPQTSRFLQGYDIKAFVSSTGKEDQKKIEDALAAFRIAQHGVIGHFVAVLQGPGQGRIHFVKLRRAFG